MASSWHSGQVEVRRRKELVAPSECLPCFFVIVLFPISSLLCRDFIFRLRSCYVCGWVAAGQSSVLWGPELIIGRRLHFVQSHVPHGLVPPHWTVMSRVLLYSLFRHGIALSCFLFCHAFCSVMFFVLTCWYSVMFLNLSCLLIWHIRCSVIFLFLSGSCPVMLLNMSCLL